MKQGIVVISLGLSALLGTACHKEESEEVLIRVKNNSIYQLDSVYVTSPGGSHLYGSLRAGQSSEYSAFSEAYSYAYVRVMANGQQLVWQPIDYVGETPLKAGKYTYELNVTDLANRRISLTLAKP